MRNKLRALGAFLLAMLMLAMPVLAEIPAVGMLQQVLMDRAIEGGREVQFSMQVQYEDLMGVFDLMGELDGVSEEERAEIESTITALKGLVNPLTLQGSYLADENGFRIKGKLLSNDVEAITATLLYADNAFYFTSNLIGDKTIAVTAEELTAKLLELCMIWLTDFGMSAEDAEAALVFAQALLSGDEEAAQLAEEYMAYAVQMLSLLQPYLEDVGSWASDIAVKEEQGEFIVTSGLAATQKMTIAITAEDIYALLQTLCARMATDEQVLALVADHLAVDGITYSPDEAAAMVMAFPVSIKADLFSSYTPAVTTMYMDDDGNLVAYYVESNGQDASFAFFMALDDAEDGQTVQMHFDMTIDGTQLVYDIVTTEFPVEETEDSISQAMAMTYSFGVVENGYEVMSMNMVMDSNIITTETEQTTNLSMSMNMDMMGEEIAFIATGTGEAKMVGDMDFINKAVSELFFGDMTSPMTRSIVTFESFEGEPLTAPASDTVSWYLRMTDEEKDAFMAELSNDLISGLMNLILLLPEESMELVLDNLM